MDTIRPSAKDVIQVSVDAVLGQQVESGAFRASPDFSQYGYCWLRDGSFTAYALDRVGEHAAAGSYHAWVCAALDRIARLMDGCVQQRAAGVPVAADALPPARFALDGTVVADDWPNFQIDGYGTWLWSLREHLARSDDQRLPETWRATVQRTARYLAAYAFVPCFDVWEMDGDGVHTSTLGSVFAGLQAAGHLLGDPDFGVAADRVRERVRSAAPDRPLPKSTLSAGVDASTLWLGTPFGVLEPHDPTLVATVDAIVDELGFEAGLRRFGDDTYFGGGAWPVLTASLGWHHLIAGDAPAGEACLAWVRAHIDATGELGEQYGGERRDAPMYREWVDRWGAPARQLTWSHAMHLILAAELDQSAHTIAPDAHSLPGDDLQTAEPTTQGAPHGK